MINFEDVVTESASEGDGESGTTGTFEIRRRHGGSAQPVEGVESVPVDEGEAEAVDEGASEAVEEG